MAGVDDDALMEYHCRSDLVAPVAGGPARQGSDRDAFAAAPTERGTLRA